MTKWKEEYPDIERIKQFYRFRLKTLLDDAYDTGYMAGIKKSQSIKIIKGCFDEK
jgi:hypothetical protein